MTISFFVKLFFFNDSGLKINSISPLSMKYIKLSVFPSLNLIFFHIKTWKFTKNIISSGLIFIL